MLDWEASETSRSHVCAHGHIHAYHSPDIFSKFDYFDGKYDDFDLDTLDLSRIPDYALYVACKATDKGRAGSGKRALARVGGDLSRMCSAKKPAIIVALRGVETRCLTLQYTFQGDVLDEGQQYTIQAPHCGEKFGSQSWLLTDQGQLVSLQVCMDDEDNLRPECGRHVDGPGLLKHLRGRLCLSSLHARNATVEPCEDFTAFFWPKHRQKWDLSEVCPNARPPVCVHLCVCVCV